MPNPSLSQSLLCRKPKTESRKRSDCGPKYLQSLQELSKDQFLSFNQDDPVSSFALLKAPLKKPMDFIPPKMQTLEENPFGKLTESGKK